MRDILPQDTPQKQCTCCKIFFPHIADYFSPGRAQCKKCRCEKSKKHYREQRDLLLEKRKQYHQDHKEVINEKRRAYHHAHKEVANERSKNWHRTHTEEAKKQNRLYRLVHKDELAAYQRRYRHDNCERLAALRKQYCQSPHGGAILRVNALKRRVLKLSASGCCTAQQLQEQLARQKRKCYYCKKRLTTYHADHVVPLSRGGANDISNIVLACPVCNLKKHNKLPHEWPEGGRLL